MIEFFVNKLLIICYLREPYSITEHTSQNRMQSYNFFPKLPNICVIKFQIPHTIPHVTETLLYAYTPHHQYFPPSNYRL